MPEEVKTATPITNLSQTVVEDNFEKFAADSNAADIAERLGKPAPKAAEPEVKELVVTEPEKKGPEVVKHKAPGSLSYKELRERVRVLEAENRGMKAVVRPEPKAEEVKEPEAAKQPETLRKRPNSEDVDPTGAPKYKTWQEYEDDLLAWNEEKILRAIDERNTKRTQETEVAQVNKLIETAWNERCEKAREAHPDFDDCLSLETGPGKLIQPGSLVDEWIMDSEHGAELLYFFHQNPAELKKFERVDGPTPGARRATVRRMLTKIEDRFAGTKEEPIPAKEKSEEVVEIPVRTTRTPPPAREVGGRGAAPADRARAAVANDDVGAYLDEMNRRDIREKFGDRR